MGDDAAVKGGEEVRWESCDVERSISPSLRNSLDCSKELAARLHQHVDLIGLNSSTRNRLAAGCYDLALEHHCAVITLVETRLAACAFALLRVMYEAYIRGVWLQAIASDHDLTNFQKLKPKPLDKMVREIDAVPNLKVVGYAKFQAHAKNYLDDYVHTGFLAVSRRISAEAIEQVHDEDQEAQALIFADMFALNAAAKILDLSGNVQAASAFHEEAVRYMNQRWPTIDAD